jgi:hypothetical protein
MKFGDYIDLIQREPTDLRIFLFDPIKYAPKLLEDYISPKELMGGFLDKYPNMFFGGKGSVTFLHLILIWRIFSIPTSTEESIFFFLIINGKKDCTRFLMQPMHLKIMILKILISQNSLHWMV